MTQPGPVRMNITFSRGAGAPSCTIIYYTMNKNAIENFYNFSQEVVDRFHQIYDNKLENLKYVPPALKQMGLGYMEILLLTRRELNLGLGESIMLLEIPDALV